jgi:hypothetical protein
MTSPFNEPITGVFIGWRRFDTGRTVAQGQTTYRQGRAGRQIDAPGAAVWWLTPRRRHGAAARRFLFLLVPLTHYT